LTIEIQHIRKSFGPTLALDDVNLSVADGEFLALLGPSGSGKTSLLRMLAGLEFPDSGEIAINGRPMSGVPARERGIGFVFQHYALFRHMTVLRNVAFGLTVRPRRLRPSASETHTRAMSLLDMMQISDLAERYPDQISGGQRQRAALARALAIQPKLLLLDEPFGALDAKVRKSLRVWLRDLHNRMGLTSIFVTHDQAEAMEMADRIAILRAGRVEQIDTPDRLYSDPASAFVHEFLGESVRFDCTVADGCAQFTGFSLPPVRTACPSGPAVAVIRPHEIELLRCNGSGIIRSVHAVGPLRHITVDLDGVTVELAQSTETWTPSAGETCGLSLAKARVYPLNATSALGNPTVRDGRLDNGQCRIRL